MAATMYDRLGDLLSETLEAGEVRFVKVETDVPPKKEEPPIEQGDNSATQAEKTAEDIISRIKKERAERLQKQWQEYKTSNTQQRATIYRAGSAENPSATSYRPKKSFVYKKISPQVASALNIFGLGAAESDAEKIKKVYKEKLMLFHPDHYAQNSAAQKEAAEKTRQLLEAYRVLLDFFSA